MTAPPTTTLTIARSVLIAALQRAAAALPAKATLPILQGVRFVPSPGELHLEATNLEQWLETTAPCVGGLDAAEPFIVDGRRLLGIVQSLSVATVDLAVSAGACTVQAGKGRFRLPVLPLGEWPGKDARLVDAGTFTLPGPTFVTGLQRTAKFVSTDVSRPTLHGVLLDATANDVRLVATDGRRLMVWPLGPSIDVVGQWILPPALVRAVPALGLDRDGAEATVTAGGQLMQVTGPLGSITSRLLEGPYPDYARFLTLPTLHTVRVDRGALAAAARRVGSFRTSQNVAAVDLTIRPDAITLTDAGSEIGSGVDEVACTATGDIALRAQADFLIDAIENVATAGTEVELAITGDKTPMYCTSTAPEDAGRRALVMPLVPAAA